MYVLGSTTITGGVVAGGALVMTGFSALLYVALAMASIIAGLFLLRAASLRSGPPAQ